ncbi:MAG TPA: hypothetical protein VJJ20_02530 [Candidatus Paceibacterota bacterium]
MEDQPKQTGASHIDLSKVLLPKKDAPSVDSARRINAGVLFEQERTATLPEPPKPEAAPVLAPQKQEPSLVKPLQTYQGDIESVVGEKNISVVSIAAAEADRRGMSKLQDSATPLNQETGRPWLRKLLMVGAGVVLLCVAGGIGFYIYLAFQPVSVAQQSPAPFILVDDTKTVEISGSDTRSSIMQTLSAMRSGVELALGLVARIQVVKQDALGALQEVSAPEFLQTLAPRIPPELVRTLLPQMLLGVHSYDENQAFMLIKADSYETAYSAMLAWEATIQADLSPLFVRTPAVRARTDLPPVLPAATSSASSTSATSSLQATTTSAASTTPISTSTPAAIPSATPFVQGSFVDQVVANRDARVVLGPEGDILLLWVFLDRSTILITTNDATLREVISRLSQASILSLPPGQ